MADSKLSALSGVSVPALTDLAYIVDETASPITSNSVTLTRLLGLLAKSMCDGRLTTESGVPVSTADRTAQATIYFTPYRGNNLGLYDGTRWNAYAFTQLSLALSSLTTDSNYDVFVYDNSGVLTLELLIWSSDTARATALTTQDGVLVKTGATTRRYIGTIRTTGTTTTEDSEAKRFVYSYYNRVERKMAAAAEATDSWSYATATWRSANNSAANRLQFVIGVAEALVRAFVRTQCYTGLSGGGYIGAGIALDATNTSDADYYGVEGNSASGNSHPAVAQYAKPVAAGFHFLQWTEIGATGGTFLGDGGSTSLLSKIVGSLFC